MAVPGEGSSLGCHPEMHRHGGPRHPPALGVLLCLVLLAAAGDQGPQECREQAVCAGTELQLQPEKPPKRWARIEWKVNQGTESWHWILTAENNDTVLPVKSPFRGRAFFQRDTLSLRLSPVGTADSGLYSVEFEESSGAVTKQCFRVSVWEPVPQPRLEAHVLHREQDWCNLSLVCAVPSAANVSYSWSCVGNSSGALEHELRLHLRVHEDIDRAVCNCTVSNPVSSSTASTDAVAACRPADSGNLPSAPSKQDLGGLPVIISGCAAAAFLGLALAAVACYWWRKRRNDPSGGHDEQILTVYEEVGKTRTSQNSNGTSEATVGGNTVYAVVSIQEQRSGLPQEPGSCTIYSTIQPTRKSPSLKRKRLDPALVSTAYVEVAGPQPVRR
ncbi:natural killer cell receptor 2B4 [Phoenicopterus ruber ruber]